MSGRNRADGWTHAKLSGHKNENLLHALILNNLEYRESIVNRLGLDNTDIIGVDFGGLSEHSVESVFENGNKTKSKTDLTIFWPNFKTNFSIKKSLSGQVYMVTVNNFIEAYELQFNEVIPSKVKEAMDLFWGNDVELSSIIQKYSNDKFVNYEKRKNRIVAETLFNYNKELHKLLIEWFKENIYNITILCFASGAVKDRSEWSEFIWYINLIQKDNQIYDEIISISEIAIKSDENKDKIVYGNKGGGTTIQLPFGFVQWHQGVMQFHHKFNKIFEIIES